jgi:hypothetical protein
MGATIEAKSNFVLKPEVKPFKELTTLTAGVLPQTVLVSDVQETQIDKQKIKKVIENNIVPERKNHIFKRELMQELGLE